MERKYKIILTVIVLSAVLLAVLDFMNQNKEIKPNPINRISKPNLTSSPIPPKEKPTTIPEVTPIPPLTISPPQISDEAELPIAFLRTLPVSGDGFYIEYFPSTKRLSVTIQSGSFSRKQVEVYNWLENQGISNARSLDILWSSNRRFVSD